MRLPKMDTIFKSVLYTSVVAVGGGLYLQLKRLEEISNSELFKEAFKIIRRNPGAVQLLGEPIKQLGFRLDDPNNFETSDRAQYYVNVKGPNDKGRVFLWGKLIDESWSVTRIELELTKHPGKRLLIKNGPKNDTEAEQ